MLLAFLLLSGLSFAESLSVEKLVDKAGPSAGDSVQVLLKFSNPFGVQVPIKIVDRNVFGGNGIDVQCLEYVLPADRSVTIAYEGIQAFQAGSFTLDKASITYTNPASGTEEAISSNSLGVEVKASAAAQPGFQEGITTIFECGGTSIKSTSYSSSSQQQQSQQQKETRDRLQGMQQQNMQDLNSLKQQMAQQQQQENGMKSRIEQDAGFRKMQDELQKQGYSLQKSRIDPEQSPQSSSQSQGSQPPQHQDPNSQQNSKSSQSQGPNPQSHPNSQSQSQNPSSHSQDPSASFQYDFQKPTGENATIRGKLESGNVTGLSKWSDDDAKALSDRIAQDPRFQQLSKSLQEQGFNRTGQKVSPPSGNLSRFTYSFSNLNETRNITGTATPQGNVTSIKVDPPEKRSDLLFWLFLLLLLLLAYLIYPKRPAQAPPAPEARISYRREALSMIAQAEQLFSQNRAKEAFALLSESVRFYFKHRVVPGKKELSTSDLLAYLKQHDRRRMRAAQNCLGLCDLVVFAKFSPDAGDFGRAAALAKKLVST